MRVLFSSTSGYGHIFPMLPLARAFIRAGHEVLWGASADVGELIVAAGVDVRPVGLCGSQLQDRVRGLRSAAAAVAPQQRASFTFPRMFGAALTPPMVADLLALARHWRPDLLIHEHGELASPLVGALLELPSVTHSFGGAIPESILVDAGERLAGLWSEHGLSIPAFAGCFTTLYLDICPPAVQSVPISHIGAVQQLRPVADTGEPPRPRPAYLVDDDEALPLVYFTLGTVQNHSPILRPVVEALAALPVRLLVTVGPDGDEAILGHQPPNVLAQRWVPQSQVLQHCAAVVSHGGSGTFLGALANGLPQLCLPQAADQFRNAEGGARSGACLVLPPTEASPEKVARAVESLLTQASFRRNAGAIATDIRAMPAPADVVDVLVRLS